MLTVEEIEVRDLDAATCSHDWQPIDGWTARYRCATCRAVGYKPCAVHPQHRRDPTIVPYRCEATRSGQKCAQPAVHSQRGKRFRCALHVRPERTEAARKALAAKDTTAGHDVTTTARVHTTAGHDDTTAARVNTTAGHDDTTAGHDDTTAARVNTTAGHDDTTAARVSTAAGHDTSTRQPMAPCALAASRGSL